MNVQAPSSWQGLIDQANSCTSYTCCSPWQQWHEQQRLQYLQQLLWVSPPGAGGRASFWRPPPSIAAATVPAFGSLAVPGHVCGARTVEPLPCLRHSSPCLEADARVWERVDALTDELTDLAAKLQAVVDASSGPSAASDGGLEQRHPLQPSSYYTAAKVSFNAASSCSSVAKPTQPPGYETNSPTRSDRHKSVSTQPTSPMKRSMVRRFLSHTTPQRRERRISRRMERFESQGLWNTPEQTIIVFDFDDTLFPTTWICDDMALQSVDNPLGIDSIREMLEKCASSAASVLELATVLADHVVIVTLARRGWIEKMITMYTPDLEGKFDELGIKVVYAREFLAAGDDSHDRWTRAKADAIAQECDKLYSQYQGQSWKNVVVVGDSDFEIEGTELTVRRWTYENRRSWQQLPRLKTVKLVDSPTCAELEQELSILEVFLESIHQHDLCACIDFGRIRDQLNLDSAQELLVSSRTESCEPPSEAIIESRLWKLCHDSDPCDPDRWRPRRVWLSKTGRLWYESLKEVKPSLFFEGCPINELEVSCLGDFRLRVANGQTPTFSKSSIQIAGKPLFAMQLKHHDSTKSGLSIVLAAESWDLRQRWIFSCHTHKVRTGSMNTNTISDGLSAGSSVIDWRQYSDGKSSTASPDQSPVGFDLRGSRSSLCFTPTASMYLQTVDEVPAAAG